jgi:hypothetical protein
MSEFSGILSIFLIVAAFMTSCNAEPPQSKPADIAPYVAQ